MVVLGQQQLNPAKLGNFNALVVARQTLGALCIKSAEPHQARPLLTNPRNTVAQIDRALGDVPVANVAAWVPHHSYVTEEAGNEVQPALFPVETCLQISATMEAQTRPPPGEKRVASGIAAGADDSAVVDAALENVELALNSIVSGRGAEQVRRQREPVATVE